MRRLSIFSLLIALCVTVSAQRVYRTQFSVYDTREDALNADHSKTQYHYKFTPQVVGNLGAIEMCSYKLEMPAAWNDYNVYLHLENIKQAYELAVGGVIIASNDDPYTPADFLISPYMAQGENEISLLIHEPENQELNAGAKPYLSERFEGCYIFAQHKTSVYDYDANILLGADNRLKLELDIIVGNDFNFEESVSVGYDIYAPDKKLVDYAVRDIIVPGKSRDTLKVRIDLGAESRFLWRNGSPKLYKSMLYIKRSGKPFEYLPLRMGPGSTSFENGTIYRNGKAITIRSKEYNAAATRAESLKQIIAIRNSGINTLIPDSPQPKWFYDLCDGLGVYVIERANINPTERSEDRNIGGTPSNNPLLVDEYLQRVKAMYYRTRNHPSIIAYTLGGERAGNGYCMYKAYQWLKGVEKERPVICLSADGEWNSDQITLP